MAPKKLLFILILLLLPACRQQQETTPTANAPSAEIETEATVVSTSTSLPPTATVPPPTAIPETATPLPTATQVPPTATVPPPTATPDVDLAVTAPEPEATLEMGSEVTLSGEAAPGEDPLTISLEAAGVTLLRSDLRLEENATTWEMVMIVPESVTGRAMLRVGQAGETTVEVPVLLHRPPTAGTTISLDYPEMETTAVASQALVFQGRVQRPINGEVTIAVLYEECRQAGARQTFEVGAGGQWWGYVVIPEFVFGPACAVAYTGEFEEMEWRAASVPLTILEANDPAAQGILVANFPLQEVKPGEPVAVYGSAYLTDAVDVSLQVDNQMVAEGTAESDRFGYWEIDLTLPAAVAGAREGSFVASTTYGSETVTARSPFLVASDE